MSVVRSGHYARRFVEQNIGEVLGGIRDWWDYEWPAVDLDLVSGGVGARAHFGHHNSVDTHLSGCYYLFGCSPRSDPGAGQQLLQTLRAPRVLRFGSHGRFSRAGLTLRHG